DGDDQADAGLMRISGDGCVKRRRSLHGIDQQDRHVGAFQMLSRHDHRDFLGCQLGLSLAPDTCGIYQTKPGSCFDYLGVYRITGCTGNGRHDDALLAGQPVNERGLAGVGAAYYRYVYLLVAAGSLLYLAGRYYLDQNVQHFAYAIAVLGRNRKNVEPPALELHRVGFQPW